MSVISRHLTIATLCAFLVVFRAECGDVIELEEQKAIEQIRQIVNSNVAQISAVKSLNLVATISAHFEPDEFDGLKSRNTKVEFQSSGAKFAFRVHEQTIPERNSSPNFNCVFDGDMWGRFEEDQHRILFISKVDQPEKVALRGTNPLWLPYLPLFYNEAEQFPFKETFASDLASPNAWDALLSAAFDWGFENDETLGKLLVAKAKLPGADRSPTSSLLMSFSEENGFLPVKWKWISDDGFQTEYIVNIIKEVPLAGAGLKFYYAKKASLIRRKNDLVISTSEINVDSLEVNSQLSDDSFLVPLEEASSIIDLNEDVAIPVPR